MAHMNSFQFHKRSKITNIMIYFEVEFYEILRPVTYATTSLIYCYRFNRSSLAAQRAVKPIRLTRGESGNILNTILNDWLIL